MTKLLNKKKIIFILLFLIQFVTIIHFCNNKHGYHIDEYYTFLSTNTSLGFYPTDRTWLSQDTLLNELVVLSNQPFNFGDIIIRQSADVHPPLHYLLYNIICSFNIGIFSKWLGLSINIVCFCIYYLLFVKICKKLMPDNFCSLLLACAILGFAPATISGVLFIRMYALLGVWFMLLLWLHLKHFFVEKRSWIFYVILSILTFLGVMTHYYLLVFLFFMAVFSIFWLLFVKKKWISAILYILSISSALFLAVTIYPACLIHIFSGYRGTGATSAFFALENTIDRIIFYLKLINDYLLGTLFYSLILAILLLIINVLLIFSKKQDKKLDIRYFFKTKLEYLFLFFIVTGYFFVVSKTALILPEEAIRYLIPAVGPFILLLIYTIHGLVTYITKQHFVIVMSIILLPVVFLNIKMLSTYQIPFLYKEQLQFLTEANERKNDCILYFYDPAYTWSISNDYEELMQYEQIYCVNVQNTTPLDDETILSSDTIYIYSNPKNMQQSISLMEYIIENNPNITEYELIRNLRFCELYKLH